MSFVPKSSANGRRAWRLDCSIIMLGVWGIFCEPRKRTGFDETPNSLKPSPPSLAGLECGFVQLVRPCMGFRTFGIEDGFNV